tara:strand:- start:1583 stop:2674 length:1092 start_codon:yes stop_codon:yes gene_type:complete
LVKSEVNKRSYHVLGVMSGTSLDGIDLAEVIFTVSEENVWDFKLISAQTMAYPSLWKDRLQAAVNFSEDELNQLNEEYTKYLSEVITTFITMHKIENLDVVSSHGHTILHRPELGITLQIGNLPTLSEWIEKDVVCDFRVQDVAYSGQGAPLVPIGDRLLFSEHDYCLNLGGFANVSYEKDGERLAYDICPVNIVLNRYAEKLGLAYDDKGKTAAKGNLDKKLLDQLNVLDFYAQNPPKSLGLEWVLQHIIPVLEESGAKPDDILQTFTHHIAQQITSQFREGASVIVTGGGAYNDYLLNIISEKGIVDLVKPSEDIIEFKEAIIFALLGVLKLRNEINCLASVTGAIKDHSSGSIFRVTSSN